MKRINFGNFALQKILNPPDVLTFLNLVCGFTSILLSIGGKHAEAVSVLLLAVVFDYFDGKTARIMQRKTDFGREMDSLADLISFGLAPAIHGYMLLPFNLFTIIALVFFVTCGMVRLARYNVMHYDSGFMGMPITTNGILFPILYSVPFLHTFYLFFFILSGIFMVAPIKVRRI